MHFGVAHHAVDFVLRQSAARRDGDALLLARAFVLRGYVQDAIRVDVEGDLNLRNAPWRG